MQDYIPRQIDINEPMKSVAVKQFDHNSRYLHVQIFNKDLTDNEDDPGLPMNLVDCRTRMYIRPKGNTESGDVAYIDGEIADGENGIVTFLLPNSVTQTVGEYQCEIHITNPSEQSHISTYPFLLTVHETIRDDDALEATVQFSALENALNQVDRMTVSPLPRLTADGYLIFDSAFTVTLADDGYIHINRRGT